MNVNTFEFNELLLSDRVLDRLGFSPYNDEHCTWGGRTLTLGKDENIFSFRIIDQEEMDDDTEGNWFDGSHINASFSYSGSFDRKNKNDYSDLYFLHQLYEVVKHLCPQHLDEFKKRCADNNMKNAIESYEEFKAKQA